MYPCLHPLSPQNVALCGSYFPTDLARVSGQKPSKMIFMQSAQPSGPGLSGWGHLGLYKAHVWARATPAQPSGPQPRVGTCTHSPPQEAPETHLTKLGQFLHPHRLHLYLKVFESGRLGQLAASFACKTLLFLSQRQLGKHFLQPGPGSSGPLSQDTPRSRGGRDVGGHSSALEPTLDPAGSPTVLFPWEAWGATPPEPWVGPLGRGLPSLAVFASGFPSSLSTGPGWGLLRAIFPPLPGPEAGPLGMASGRWRGSKFSLCSIVISLDFSTVGERAVSLP